jgi:hypothetical protein
MKINKKLKYYNYEISKGKYFMKEYIFIKLKIKI